MKLVWTNRFIKKFKKYIDKHPDLEKIIFKKLKIFENNPFNIELRNHKLSGKLNELRAIVIDYDCRLIYCTLEKDKALLLDIGSHDEVY